MEEENILPPGFRFHPTDEELITCYLTNKLSDFSFTSRAIVDVDFNKCEPWDLPAKASMGEKEWYFFSFKDRKYPTGMRTNRATEAGYWKTTGKDKEIFSGGVLVGMKKTLVFYRGRAPKGEKSNWVMHEYRVESDLVFKPTKEERVVCRVFQKSTTMKKPQQTSSSPQSIESPCDTNTFVNELGDFDLQNTSDIAIQTRLSTINNIPSLQTYNNDNMNLNWNIVPPQDPSITLASLCNWPSSFLNSNLPMNSLLLRALQFQNYRPVETINTDQSFTPHFANHDNDIASTSSRGLDLLQRPPQEQTYDLHSDIFAEALCEESRTNFIQTKF